MKKEYLGLTVNLGEENIEVHMERLTIQALELVRYTSLNFKYIGLWKHS